MSRYIFSPEGLQNLKKTVHQTVALLDNWYWVNRCTSLFVRNGNKRLDSEQIQSFWDDESNHIRFKPKHMILLNEISKCFGYRNFRELETVSESSAPSIPKSIESDSALLMALVSVFKSNIADRCPLNSQAVSVMNTMAHLAVSSWQLNKDLRPVKEQRVVQINNRVQGGSGYNLEIIRFEGYWEFRLFFKHSSFDEEPFIIEKIEDMTTQGELLPPVGIFHLREPNAVVDDVEDTALLALHSSLSSSLSGDKHGILPVIAYDKLYESTEAITLLRHYHAIQESLKGVTFYELQPLIDSTDSIHSFRLLAYLDQLEFTHHSKHENASWFMKPHDLKTRIDLMNQTVGIYSKAHASKLEYVNGTIQFNSPS
ncbi:hypothetical protein [Vibrio harveyi]|uniref:hypothetical protein n=1 Tax=Vibrio harveyi TaxID=669 RepID=UPI003CEAD990